MTSQPLPRPRDPIQLGKLIVDIATEQIEDRAEEEQRFCRRGSGPTRGKRGGHARVESLPEVERKAVAKNAAQSRWAKKIKDPAT